MKIENSITINGKVVHEVGKNKGVIIYQSDDDVIYICTSNAVAFTAEVNPYCGEGGGGEIEIEKAQ